MTQVEQILQNAFGNLSFQKVENVEAIRRFDSKHSYCLDDQDRIIGIASIENEIEQIVLDTPFQNLQYLNLGDNTKLKSLTFEVPMPQLRHLDVSDSALEVLQLPMGFDALEWLDISRNQLKTFVPLNNSYPKLKYLDLSGNDLEDFNPIILSKFPALEGLYLKNNKFGDEKGFVDNHPNCLAEMSKVHQAIDRTGAVENNEFKVLLVGNGGVGKSCLVERLVYGTFQKRHHSTHGISIEQYNKSDLPYILNLWDFGGQDIYHATHRLFMQSNAIYLLLWDEYTHQNPQSILTESGQENPYDNHDIYYWLDYINLEGKKSPVIITKTKKLKDTALLDHPERDNIKKDAVGQDHYYDFTAIDSGEKEERLNGFDDLRYSIRKGIERNYSKGKMPESWAQLRQHLRNKREGGEALIAYEEYLQIANSYDLGRTAEALLEDWLVQSGVVFHKKGYMNNAVILDQAWAIKAIYTLFDRVDNTKHKSHYYRLKKNKGKITGKQLKEIWQRAPYNYSQAEQELFVQFMLTCHLCFELTDKENKYSIPFEEREFIAPQLLSDEEPSGVGMFRDYNPNRFYIRYNHRRLHYGIIQSFIVQTQYLAEKDDIWQNGILIKEENERALVLAQRNKGRNSSFIQVEVNKTTKGLELLSKIQHLLEEIQGKMGVEELVSHDGKSFVDRKKLLDEKNQNELVVAENGEWIPKSEYDFLQKHLSKDRFDLPEPAPVDHLIERVKTEKANATSQPSAKGKIYFSYAWGVNEESGQNREELVDQLYDSLIEDGFDVKRDKKNVKYGGTISTFMQEIGKGDLVVVFISKKYAASQYCMYELSEIARNCMWEKKAFTENILPVVVEFIPFDDPEELEKHFDYWEKEEQKWSRLIDKRKAQMGIDNMKRYERIKTISQNFGNLAEWIVDINASDNRLLEESDFKLVKQAVLDRLNG